MDTASIVAFSAVAALLTVTPGADMALVTRNALDGGQRAAFATTLGIVTGIMAWALLSAVGIAALLAASATAFSILKLAGAAYLVVLGVRAIWRSRGRATPERNAPPERVGERGSPFLQGLLTNLLNPKIAVFYTTLLPQFIVPGDPVLIKSLVLAAIHNALGLVWLSGYAWAVTTAGDLLRRPRARRALDRLTGVVLIALGVRLALERR
jgi:threonine/homoserine/homoserine lactone efflux protein